MVTTRAGRIPRLRQRTEVIPVEASFFLERCDRRYRRDVLLCPDVIARFKTHAWQCVISSPISSPGGRREELPRAAVMFCREQGLCAAHAHLPAAALAAARARGWPHRPPHVRSHDAPDLRNSQGPLTRLPLIVGGSFSGRRPWCRKPASCARRRKIGAAMLGRPGQAEPSCRRLRADRKPGYLRRRSQPNPARAAAPVVRRTSVPGSGTVTATSSNVWAAAGAAAKTVANMLRRANCSRSVRRFLISQSSSVHLVPAATSCLRRRSQLKPTTASPVPTNDLMK